MCTTNTQSQSTFCRFLYLEIVIMYDAVSLCLKLPKEFDWIRLASIVTHELRPILIGLAGPSSFCMFMIHFDWLGWASISFHVYDRFAQITIPIQKGTPKYALQRITANRTTEARIGYQVINFIFFFLHPSMTTALPSRLLVIIHRLR